MKRSLAPVAGVALALCAGACSPPERPSVVLITVDTLRADHLSLYGYSRPTSAGWESIAASGVVFSTVFAPIPETGPSFASMHTGLWPAQVEVPGNAHPLAAPFETLAERFKEAGYDTAGFISGFPLVRRLSGLDQGFALFDDTLPDPRGRVPRVQRGAEKTTDAALAWLRRRAGGPFFLWVHYYDPHGDYRPPPPYDAMFPPDPPGPVVPGASIPEYQRLDGSVDAAVYVAAYDGEIRRVVDASAQLLEASAAAAGSAGLIVALTADHGESLTEHGDYFDHGNELYSASLRVPLVVAGPGITGGGRRVEGVARTPDLFPTLLDLAGLPVPPHLAGISLAPAARDPGGVLTGREAFAEARFANYRPLTPTADVQPKLALLDDRFTVILRLTSGRVEAYDRHHDPGETRDILGSAAAAALPDVAPRLGSALAGHRRALIADETGAAGAAQATLLGAELRADLERLAAAAAGQAAAP